MQDKRVVVIGHGYWGKNIARNLHGLGVLYGVCDADERVASEVSKLYPQAARYSLFSDVLADANVDAVAISTPADSHAFLCLEAIRAGKDIFVEKPLSLTLEDGRRVAELAAESDVILMVGHLLEYHPGVLELLHLAHSGKLGKLQYVYSNRLNLGRFRREENILWSFAPHDISVMLRLVAQSPVEVMTAGGAYLRPNVADTTVTNLVFPAGIRAHIFVSWLHPYKEHRLVVVGSDKMAVFNDLAAHEHKLVLYDQGADWINHLPVPRKGVGEPVTFDAVEPLREEMAHFLDSMRRRRTPKTDIQNGLRVLEVLDAAQVSLQNGGAPVKLSTPSISQINGS